MPSLSLQRSLAVAVAALGVLATPSARAVDDGSACRLLDRSDVAGIQGTEIVAEQAALRPAAGLELATCFLRGRDPARSVSLSVTRSAGEATPRQRWNELFHPAEPRAPREEEMRRTAAARRDESEASPAPRAVSGLGDEAFWIGNEIYGALYVLDGDAFLRVSVGGPGDLESKLARSRNLATRALHRLHER